jgi:hypothetical protein
MKICERRELFFMIIIFSRTATVEPYIREMTA